MKNIGIVLILLGLAMVAFTGFNFVTREKVVDLGSVEIIAPKNHPIQWSPIVGGALLAAGIVVLVVKKK